MKTGDILGGRERVIQIGWKVRAEMLKLPDNQRKAVEHLQESARRIDFWSLHIPLFVSMVFMALSAFGMDFLLGHPEGPGMLTLGAVIAAAFLAFWYLLLQWIYFRPRVKHLVREVEGELLKDDLLRQAAAWIDDHDVFSRVTLEKHHLIPAATGEENAPS